MSFPVYAHAIYHALRHQYPSLLLKLGQVQQLLAASLGHATLASYQHAQPPEKLGQQILVDHRLLRNRCAQLGLPDTLPGAFLTCFQSNAKQTIYRHHAEYVFALIAFAATAMPKLPSVLAHPATKGAEIAFTEGDGFTIKEPLELRGPLMHVVSCAVKLSSPNNRLHLHPNLFFDGCVSVDVVGRRCLGEFVLTGSLVDGSNSLPEALEFVHISDEY